MKNIFLTGMMGSGKSSTARELAAALGMKHMELDALIEERAGKSINDIFSEDGEEHFRRLEKEALMRVAEGENQVVSTGGGVVKDFGNRKLMKGNGVVIYLKASVKQLAENLKGVDNRPLLKVADPEKRLAEILEEREDSYEDSDYTIDTEGKNPKQIAQEILGIWETLREK